MLFNSFTFGIFLILVFGLYWFAFNKNLKNQNILLLISSYVFYGWWDYRFLSLILISSLTDFFLGHKIAHARDGLLKKIYLGTSLAANIGLLGFFKYYNFFVESLVDSFTLFGISLQTYSLSIILPVGISFYTFQTLSYSIDIYQKKFTPHKDIISFLAFVSFFPQLVAGPIERASHLLPQFEKPRVFAYNQSREGLKLILWGLFKKVVIADQCAIFVNQIFSQPSDYSGSELLLGAIFFTIQIYGDFSGYSDIAIGTARLFGFDLMRNFRYPFFSRDIAEFWRRWHISLSTWFRDYVYIPLGGSRGSITHKIRNVMIIFILSGLWHGANWTFITWGFLNALYYLPLLLSNANRAHTNKPAEGKLFPSLSEFIKILCTFLLTTLAFIFFRANSMEHAFTYLEHLFAFTNWTMPQHSLMLMLGVVVAFLAIEWIHREMEHPLHFAKWSFSLRYITYGTISFLILGFSSNHNNFIYFQF